MLLFETLWGKQIPALAEVHGAGCNEPPAHYHCGSRAAAAGQGGERPLLPGAPTLIGWQRVAAGNERLPSPPPAALMCSHVPRAPSMQRQQQQHDIYVLHTEIPIRGGWLTCCML